MTGKSLTAIAILAILGCASGCTATPPTDRKPDATAPIVIPTSGAAPKIVRKTAQVSQVAFIAANSFYVNPVLRPVSHVSSLSSYVVKSAGGAMRRVAIAGAQMPSLDGPLPPLANRAPMDLTEWERNLDDITATRQSLGTIEFLVDGDEYFPRLEFAIANAQRSVDIRTYIFDNDDFALEVANQLKRRSTDIDVRVLVDSIGNMQAMQVDADDQPEDHRTPLTMKHYFHEDSDVRLRRSANPWLTGDHTKTTIVDGEVAYVGGMNIGREYRYDWHDLMMEVRGPVVNELQQAADIAWARAGVFGDLAGFVESTRPAPAYADDEGYPVRILRTRDFDSDIYKAQLAAIQNAQSYILIQNAYFADDRTVYELARARRRGVDVRVIIPAEGNHGMLDLSHAVAVNHMLQHGIRVYRYPGMSHMKAAIYDGWVCVGSANFDKLSLKINKELNLATSDPGVAKALLERVFIPDLQSSEEILAPVEVHLGTRIAEVVVDELL